MSTEHKLHNGLVRCGYNVLHFSDRDIAAFLAPFNLRDLGRGKANRKLVEVVSNFRPEMVLLGHCDIIANETLESVRKAAPGVRIAYRNVDPLFVPANVEAILRRVEHVDTIFVTTAGPGLDKFRGRGATIHYMPNPTDVAIETLDNAVCDDLPIDLFFCGNSNEHTKRSELVVALKQALEEDPIAFKAFGYFGEPNVWGRDYDAVLAQCKAGLNLNRQEGDFLYSSARLAQLMGNGILAFIDASNRMNELLGDDTAVYFSGLDDLIEKARRLSKDNSERKRIAANGRRHYREHFSSERVARYIVERTMEIPFSRDYLWSDY